MPMMRNQNAGRDLPDVRLPGDPAAEKGQEPEKMGKARTRNCVTETRIENRLRSEQVLMEDFSQRATKGQ